MSADTTTPPATAAGAELSIPKHRFDEVNNEVRRLRDEMALKDRLYMEQQQRAQQPRAQELTPEETGLDPQTHQAVVKTAKMIADRMISQERQVFENQIGILASRTEKAELLARKGSDKSKYLSDIEQMQKEHFQRTGGFMPAEVCLDLLQSREKDARIRELEARLSGQPVESAAPAPSVQAAATGVPNAAATRQIPGGAPAALPQKSFSELSVDEMEARLQEQFGSGAVL